MFRSAPTMVAPRGIRPPQSGMCSYAPGEVISITSLPVLVTLFSWLSGKSAMEIKGYFYRKLAAASRKDHKVKVLVSEEKVFGLVYSFKKGQLTISFNYAYGEWNSFGFPQHSCILPVDVWYIYSIDILR